MGASAAAGRRGPTAIDPPIARRARLPAHLPQAPRSRLHVSRRRLHVVLDAVNLGLLGLRDDGSYRA